VELGVGSFKQHGLSILGKFCTIAEMKNKVKEEENWLAQCGFSSSELISLKDALWHKEPNESFAKLHKG